MPISPFHERTTHENGMTFGLSPAGYDIRVAEKVWLMGGEFKLASTVERFTMPHDLIAQVCDKSSLARKGLAVQNTIIEPGWRGYLTLELTNHGWNTLQLEAGSPIAQIIFMRLEEATEQPYDGRYQDQPAGPQQAK